MRSYLPISHQQTLGTHRRVFRYANSPNFLDWVDACNSLEDARIPAPPRVAPRPAQNTQRRERVEEEDDDDDDIDIQAAPSGRGGNRFVIDDEDSE
jgi:hypothetical protein